MLKKLLFPENCNKKKGLVLLSGGIDSTVALYLSKSKDVDVGGLEFFYEGRPEVESKRVLDICEASNTQRYIINYPNIKSPFENEKISFLESNALYYILAGGLAKKIGAELIIAGRILNDWENLLIPQAHPKYYLKLNNILETEYGKSAPKIITPLIYMNKIDVIKTGNSLNVPFELTWSCPNDSFVECGSCLQCVEKREAFAAINGK